MTHLSHLLPDCYSYISNCSAAVKAAWVFFAVTFSHVVSLFREKSSASVNTLHSIRKRADAHVKKRALRCRTCVLVLDGQRAHIPRKAQANAANQFHT